MSKHIRCLTFLRTVITIWSLRDLLKYYLVEAENSWYLGHCFQISSNFWQIFVFHLQNFPTKVSLTKEKMLIWTLLFVKLFKEINNQTPDSLLKSFKRRRIRFEPLRHISLTALNTSSLTDGGLAPRQQTVSVTQHYWGLQFKILEWKTCYIKGCWLSARAAAAGETLKPSEILWLVAIGSCRVCVSRGKK